MKERQQSENQRIQVLSQCPASEELNCTGFRFGTQTVHYQPGLQEQSFTNSFGTNIINNDGSPRVCGKTTSKNFNLVSPVPNLNRQPAQNI
jgi:hypothetical protein